MQPSNRNHWRDVGAPTCTALCRHAVESPDREAVAEGVSHNLRSLVGCARRRQGAGAIEPAQP